VSSWLNDSIRPRFRTIDGLSIRYAESEDHDDHALLLRPWPESLFAFEPTWLRLAEHAHLVAVDLPGFGHSQRSDALLSPRAMGGFVVRLADAFGLENPHVVGPDIGTGASLFAATSRPERFRSLVVGSGGSAFPLQLGGRLKDWVEARDLDEYRSADPRQIVDGALTASLERYQLPDHVRQDYLSAYDGDRFVESMRYVRTYPTELPILRDLLPEIQTPVQIIAGRARPSGATCQRRVPPRAAAQQQARPHQHRALHLGGRGRRVRRARHQLVERTPSDPLPPSRNLNEPPSLSARPHVSTG
jgi:pimeloyl-ACP methyl ester carboxylesterase